MLCSFSPPLPSLYSCFFPRRPPSFFCFFFFNDTATTEIYTLSLHDALPIWPLCVSPDDALALADGDQLVGGEGQGIIRSEEHTSELQSHLNLVCRLLLEKKKKQHVKYLFSRH